MGKSRVGGRDGEEEQLLFFVSSNSGALSSPPFVGVQVPQLTLATSLLLLLAAALRSKFGMGRWLLVLNGWRRGCRRKRIARRLWGWWWDWEGQAGGRVGTAGRNVGVHFRFCWAGASEGAERRCAASVESSVTKTNRQNSAGRIGADGRMKMAAVLGKRPSLCGKIQQRSRLAVDGGWWTGGGDRAGWQAGQEIVARPVSLPRSAVVCLGGRSGVDEWLRGGLPDGQGHGEWFGGPVWWS